MRQRTARARIVTPDLTYVRYGLLIDDTVATVYGNARVTVRQLTAIELSVVDGGGRRRIAGVNEQGEPEVWTVDKQGCQSCGGGMKTMPTVPDEVPV